jgi:adenosylmethionine-8-amino-7-oxononanoate aminotransferase
VLLAPPYVCTAEDIAAIVTRFGDAVEAAVAGL